jgi:hypothetical protein
MITIDNVEYDEENLSEDAMLCISQIRDIQTKKVALRMSWEQIEAAEGVFIERLRVALPSAEE